MTNKTAQELALEAFERLLVDLQTDPYRVNNDDLETIEQALTPPSSNAVSEALEAVWEIEKLSLMSYNDYEVRDDLQRWCETIRAALEARGDVERELGHTKDDLKYLQSHCRSQGEEIEKLKREVATLNLDRARSTKQHPEKDRVMALMEKQLYNLHNNFIYLCKQEYPKTEREKTENILAEYAKVKGE